MINEKRRRQLMALCGELGPEDGTDPKLFARAASSGAQGPDRKVHQLCGQVARALNLALSSADQDELQTCLVSGVSPAPDARRLRVLVGSPDPAAAQVALQTATGWLRAQVADAIHRKRTPTLVFEVVEVER